MTGKGPRPHHAPLGARRPRVPNAGPLPRGTQGPAVLLPRVPWGSPLSLLTAVSGLRLPPGPRCPPGGSGRSWDGEGWGFDPEPSPHSPAQCLAPGDFYFLCELTARTRLLGLMAPDPAVSERGAIQGTARPVPLPWW